MEDAKDEASEVVHKAHKKVKKAVKDGEILKKEADLDTHKAVDKA